MTPSFLSGTNNSPKRGGDADLDSLAAAPRAAARGTKMEISTPPPSMIIQSSFGVARSRKKESFGEEAFGQRAISPPYHPPSPSSGISGPIKGISIHPFPPSPSTPGMHQTGSDNPFYDCETDYGRQSSTKKYKTFGESMHDIKSGKITQNETTSSPTHKFNDHS